MRRAWERTRAAQGAATRSPSLGAFVQGLAFEPYLHSIS
jgi:hypothetical protein